MQRAKITAIADRPIEKIRLILRGRSRNQRVKNFGAHAVLPFVELQLVDHLPNNLVGGESAARDGFDELFFGHVPWFFWAGHPNSFDLCVMYTKPENAATVRAQREIGWMERVGGR